jgi:hypothetical protein
MGTDQENRETSEWLAGHPWLPDPTSLTTKDAKGTKSENTKQNRNLAARERKERKAFDPSVYAHFALFAANKSLAASASARLSESSAGFPACITVDRDLFDQSTNSCIRPTKPSHHG